MEEFDTTRPNIARVYDYWLGGKDNYAADRELAHTMTEVNPGIPAMARVNREFITAAVRRPRRPGSGSSSISARACRPARPCMRPPVP
jgi:hypothetical protein